jgi:hypothetical protein
MMARMEPATCTGTCHLERIICGGQPPSRVVYRSGGLTPRTIPVGKMIPQANPCTRMCVHSIESMGSCDMTSPSAILFTWCSCAVTAVPNSSAAARAAHRVVALMFGLNGAECVAFAGSDEFCGSGVEAQALIDVQRHSRMVFANVPGCGWAGSQERASSPSKTPFMPRRNLLLT